jgi:hypothetical protein
MKKSLIHGSQAKFEYISAQVKMQEYACEIASSSGQPQACLQSCRVLQTSTAGAIIFILPVYPARRHWQLKGWLCFCMESS